MKKLSSFNLALVLFFLSVRDDAVYLAKGLHLSGLSRIIGKKLSDQRLESRKFNVLASADGRVSSVRSLESL